uniref:Hypothetical chloroplast RF34 n=2 Tax=Membranoptera TaxID=158697 RepID=A0A1L1YAW3_9FLOR|nr:hypothetical chloroplast RF34 [Membranoptera weeksiae]YP_009332956.1 hypothetical chloroplast RF34 [Membranoptera tenuis]AHZ94750.1 hypothetical chloroplast RF34 [Membranoptera weeksiae]AKL79212.1 hypothetical chloroplast RF34 [Membranoptera tenuis]
MCICVNCRHINECKTYIFIEKQHKNINLKDKNIIFIPKNTLIQINIHKKINYTVIDWDLIECLSFVEKPGSWLN